MTYGFFNPTLTQMARLPSRHTKCSYTEPGDPAGRARRGGNTMIAFRDLGSLAKNAGSSWMNDKAPRLGAALAYYATFSLAPLLLISVAVGGFFFGKEATQGHVFGQ